MSTNISILVLSSDKYKAIWPPFYSLLNKYWSDFNGNIYHYSESLSVNESRVISINSFLPNKASSWSQGLLFALDYIQEPYVILMLEDFLLNINVDNKIILEYLEFMKTHKDVRCFRLVPHPPPSVIITHEYGEFSDDQPYRVSTQMAIWDKAFLKELIDINENPWEFEVNASKRSKKMSAKIYGVLNTNTNRIVSYLNGIITGKLTKKSLLFLNQEGISLKEKLPVNNRLEEYYWFSASTLERKILDFINSNLYSFMWKYRL